MVNGIPTNFNRTNITTASNKNTKRISFPFHLKCLNFRENNGSSTTNNIENTIAITIRKEGLSVQSAKKATGSTARPIFLIPTVKAKLSFGLALNVFALNKAIDEIKIAFAGVGTPIKESL